MYNENTKIIQMRCSDINLNPVNQAVKFIPSPQVSFIISIRHSPHHIIIAKNIRLKALPKCGKYRMSIIAIPIKNNSSDSSTKDAGNGMVKFLFIMNQFAMMRVQNTTIFHLNAAIKSNMTNGDKHITAKALNPALIN